MTDSLFDAAPYGPGRTPRRLPTEPTAAQNDGQWHLVLRKGKEPHPLAHRLAYKTAMIMRRGKSTATAWEPGMRWEGGWRTRCGLMGAALDLPEGPVNACPKCAG